MILDINSMQQTYYDEYDSFCYQNCIRQILEWFQVNNAKFYINTSLCLTLKKQQDNEYNIDDDNARNVLPKYKDKIMRYYPYDKNKYEVWKENLEKLKSGVPIITGVDSYYLKHLPYFKKSHGIHTVILAGYSLENNKVNIIDWFAPWFFKGSEDFENYIEARDSENIFDGGIFSGLPIMNNWAEIDNNGWNTDIMELIHSNIDLSINQYYLENESKDNCSKGIYALREVLNILEGIKLLDIEEKKKALKKLYYNLYGVVKRKVFFRHFLDNAYFATNIEQFNDSKIFITEIINGWEELLNVVMKGAFRCKDETLLKISEKLLRIIENEEEFYEHMIKLSNILK